MGVDLESFRERTGLPLVAAFAFGDSPALADALLAFVTRGTKRATAGSVADAEADEDPVPAPGHHWGVLDGSGELRFVIRTVEVQTGRLDAVTPAFAWDEGEHDRTLESWLDGHRAFFARQGVADPDALLVLFERFEVVWPVPDATRWWAEGVRELRFDERERFVGAYRDRWGTTEMASRGVLHDVATLPALVLEVGGERVGVAAFRVRPGGVTECVTMDAFAPGHGAVAALTRGLVALGRSEGWTRLWLVTTNDNTAALRAYQRADWTLVALHRGAVDEARTTQKPGIPDVGIDGIALHSELELEIRLD